MPFISPGESKKMPTVSLGRSQLASEVCLLQRWTAGSQGKCQLHGDPEILILEVWGVAWAFGTFVKL